MKDKLKEFIEEMKEKPIVKRCINVLIILVFAIIVCYEFGKGIGELIYYLK